VSAKGKRPSAKAAGIGLMNWPPSRGPMPAWMQAEPKYLFKPPTIRMMAKGEKLPTPTPAQPQPVTAHERRVQKVALSMMKKTGLKTVTATSMNRRVNETRKLKLSVITFITDLLSLTPRQASRLVWGLDRTDGRKRAHLASELPAREFNVLLDYPLSHRALITIKPFRTVSKGPGGKTHQSDERQTLGYVLWQLAQAYQRLYAEDEKWGIWGHSIDDLVFERVEMQDDVIRVGVGS